MRTALPSTPRRMWQLGLLAGLLSLSGCKIPFLGGDEAKATEEGKAIGSACRHALRGIEDCYNQYPSADKPAVFAGWKEMDEYMRENKIEGQATPPKPVASEPEPEEDEEPVPKKKAKR